MDFNGIVAQPEWRNHFMKQGGIPELGRLYRAP